MDFVKSSIGGGDAQGEKSNQQGQSGQQEQQSSGGAGGFLGGVGDKLNSIAGGGNGSEKNEGYLDKGIDAAQQYGLGQGKQDHETAVEQAKDEHISDFIRDQYKSTGGDR